ncbi:MAG: Phosphoribosylamine--glycine ligase [Spirochaetes bacterium ADurb.Bin315]|jgi:phosphoribosylamine--glycine ligase|nr:phosphoribosylamine--glycine ligase [Spirochaetota bacterium]NLL24270.1 phosphoribosylamine--glycine ligase [Spirochaetales bacterium]OQA42766.1 MAG: Phosphoribosylamine--glycine ligase [Spirochaetes bacterium ADurb.Bin315]HOE88727.1 phosphoribosylamine--glycine ligase [Sphaerochaeta sp.]HOR79427.1 phosphoribosylamine--glycine ligase [Sphaerochaeta sp.]
MRVLVLGSGAKDHAIAWWFSQSRLISALYVAPGNAGTESIAKNIEIDPSDPEAVYRVCQTHTINYVFVGTEAPLFTGVIDYLNERGIDTFGAPKRALPLEGDRDFARKFTERHRIPAPRYVLFRNTDDLSAYLKEHEGERFVVKSNQIAPSRVMVDSTDYTTLMEFSATLLESGPIILEQHLAGLPLTITLFVDTNSYMLLPICSDYMRVESGGTPTGGMGSICPVPLQDSVKEALISRIIEPTLNGLREEHMAYKGVLTISIILTKEGPMLVDYHVRFNDPAAQAFIPLICTDLIEILTAMKKDTLGSLKLCCSSNSAVALVVASEGYPQKPVTGKILNPIPAALLLNAFEGAPRYFFGGVQKRGNDLVTTGGRNVTVVGIDYNIMSANKRAYQGVVHVQFENAWYRQDIGNKFFEN